MIPGLGRSPGEGKGYPLWYSDLEDSMDYTVHGVAKIFMANRWRNSGNSDRLYIFAFYGFPGGSDGKASACSAGDLGSTPGLRRPPGEGEGYPLWYSGLENSMDHTVHRVAKIFMANRWRNSGNSDRLYFGGLQNHCRW